MADQIPLVLDGGSHKRLPDGDNLHIKLGLDVAAAGVLNIGTVNATSMSVGRSGQTVTFPGNVTVQGIETVEGNTVLEEDVTLGDASDDRITMGGRFGTAAAPNFTFSNDANHIVIVDTSPVETVGRQLAIYGGSGGASSGGAAGGAGGNLTILAGTGGAGDATFAAGDGGDLNLRAASAGADGGGGGATGGDLKLEAGASTTGSDGSITLGATTASAISLGNATDNTTITQVGTGQVTFTGNVDMPSADVSGLLTVGGADHEIRAVGDAIVLGGTSTTAASALVSLTSGERTALTGVNGMIVYDETLNSFYGYVGGSWTQIAAGSSGSGTDNVSWTINQDHTTGDQDAYLGLFSGDGTSAFQGFWTLDATTDPPLLVYTVTDDGTADSPIVGIGAAGVTDASTAELRLNSGTGAATRQATLQLDPATQDLVVNGTNLNSFSSAVNFDAEAGIDVSGGQMTFTGTNIDLDPTGSFNLAMDAGQGIEMVLADNNSSAFLIREGALGDYIRIDTGDGSEEVGIGNTTTNPDFQVYGSGQATFNGNVDCVSGLDVIGGNFNFTGGTINLDPTGSFDLSMDAAQNFTVFMGLGGACRYRISDNSALAFLIEQNTDDYLLIDTTDAAEAMSFGNASTNPDFAFLGSGAINASNGTLNVPSGTSFLIASTALTTANFTAPNMDTLLDGSDASALHYHGVGGAVTGMDTGACSVGDVAYMTTTANSVDQADADALATSVFAGVVTTVDSGPATFDGVLASSGRTSVACESDVVAGDRVYVSTTLGRVCRSGGTGFPSANPDVVVEVGYAVTSAAANVCDVVLRGAPLTEL